MLSATPLLTSEGRRVQLLDGFQPALAIALQTTAPQPLMVPQPERGCSGTFVFDLLGWAGDSPPSNVTHVRWAGLWVGTDKCFLCQWDGATGNPRSSVGLPCTMTQATSTKERAQPCLAYPLAANTL